MPQHWAPGLLIYGPSPSAAGMAARPAQKGGT